MADNILDYATMLADMEAKKAVLEAGIASLRIAIAAGALGTMTGDIPAGSTIIAPSPGAGSGDIPKGAFLGKSVPEAVSLYFATVRKKCTGSEIEQGLKKGGIESTSKNFEVIVNNTLYRLKAQGKVLRFDDGWGLAEWYPEGFRSRIDQNKKTKGKKRGPKKKTKIKAASENSAKATKGSETTRPKALVENYFSTHSGAEVSAKELASTLGLGTPTVILILSQMARKGWLEKAANGKFRRSTKVTSISKAG